METKTVQAASLLRDEGRPLATMIDFIAYFQRSLNQGRMAPIEKFFKERIPEEQDRKDLVRFLDSLRTVFKQVSGHSPNEVETLIQLHAPVGHELRLKNRKIDVVKVIVRGSGLHAPVKEVRVPYEVRRERTDVDSTSLAQESLQASTKVTLLPSREHVIKLLESRLPETILYDFNRYHVSLYDLACLDLRYDHVPIHLMDAAPLLRSHISEVEDHSPVTSHDIISAALQVIKRLPVETEEGTVATEGLSTALATTAKVLGIVIPKAIKYLDNRKDLKEEYKDLYKILALLIKYLPT